MPRIIRPTRPHRPAGLLAWGVAVMLFLLAGAVSTPAKAAPLDDTWRAAEIWLPPETVGFFRTDMGDTNTLARLDALAGKDLSLPTVLFLHGCTKGRKPAGWTMARHLARAGYAVILPDSFARPDRPRTCNRWSFTPFDVDAKKRAEVLAARRAELDLALARTRALPWVDQANLFVMGYDEGADALAAWDGDKHIRGRVLISSLCPEGLAGTHVATLTVGAAGNPLFGGRSPSTCAMKGPVEQKNIEAPIHDVTGLANVRGEILDFLARNKDTTP